MNLLNNYEKFQAEAPRGLESLRQAGLSFLQTQGLPNRKNEDWKYTSTKELQEANYVPSLLKHEVPSHELLMKVRSELNSEFLNLVFINGAYNDILSSALPEGLTLESTTESLDLNFQDGFDALNAAYTERLWNLKISKNTSVDKIVNIVHFLSSNEKASLVMTHSRVIVEVGSGSSVKIIESFLGSGVYFTNSKTIVKVAANAKADFIHLQAESLEAHSISRTEFELQAGAHVHSLSFACGGRLARHSLVVDLRGEGATAVVNGASIVQGIQHVDHNTSINHHVGHCDTQQLYKGILDGESRSVFNGRVYIAKDAQKANSEQLNNNLLLSNKAEADSKPMLEIYADDVKAGHGSTVGQLNKEELFYLQSRCISKDKAVAMLSYGFLSDVVLRLDSDSMQNWLKKYLDQAFLRLKAEV